MPGKRTRGKAANSAGLVIPLAQAWEIDAPKRTRVHARRERAVSRVSLGRLLERSRNVTK